jgi:hypothetical protein
VHHGNFTFIIIDEIDNKRVSPSNLKKIRQFPLTPTEEKPPGLPVRGYSRKPGKHGLTFDLDDAILEVSS